MRPTWVRRPCRCRPFFLFAQSCYVWLKGKKYIKPRVRIKSSHLCIFLLAWRERAIERSCKQKRLSKEKSSFAFFAICILRMHRGHGENWIVADALNIVLASIKTQQVLSLSLVWCTGWLVGRSKRKAQSRSAPLKFKISLHVFRPWDFTRIYTEYSRQLDFYWIIKPRIAAFLASRRTDVDSARQTQKSLQKHRIPQSTWVLPWQVNFLFHLYTIVRHKLCQLIKTFKLLNL